MSQLALDSLSLFWAALRNPEKTYSRKFPNGLVVSMRYRAETHLMHLELRRPAEFPTFHEWIRVVQSLPVQLSTNPRRIGHNIYASDIHYTSQTGLLL